MAQLVLNPMAVEHLTYVLPAEYKGRVQRQQILTKTLCVIMSKMKNHIKILILIIAVVLSNSIFAKVEMDTITTWSLYKDSELLIQSNYFNSKIYTVELNSSDKFENLRLSVFYDFNSETINRKIQFKVGKEIIAEFEENKNSREPFRISRKEIDAAIIGKLNEPITIIYTDSINENGILVGFILFKNE